MALIDSYTNANKDTIELRHTEHQGRDRWRVICWTEAGDCHWDVDYIVTGHLDGNPNRQLTRPTTKAEARAEFEKWR